MRKSIHSTRFARSGQVISSSPLQTKSIAKALAKTLLESQQKKGATVVALAGELGSGKTMFTQGFAKGLGVRGHVLSPTFLIIKEYEISSLDSRRGGRNTTQSYDGSPHRMIGAKSETNTKYKIQNTKYFYHIDCYRLGNPAKELLRLGFKKIIADPHAIVVVEWADRIKSIIPKDTLWLTFSHGGQNQRTITIKRDV